MIQIDLYTGPQCLEDIAAISYGISCFIAAAWRQSVYFRLCQRDVLSGQHQLIGHCQRLPFIVLCRPIDVRKPALAMTCQGSALIRNRNLAPGVNLLGLGHNIHHIHPLIGLERASIWGAQNLPFAVTDVFLYSL